jgi:hypothetical protein
VTLGDLRTYVLDRLSISSADTAKVTQITTVLNQEFLRLVMEEDFNVATASIGFTAASQDASLPATWAKILDIRAAGVVMQPVTWQRMAAYEAATALGVNASDLGPSFYAVKPPLSLRIWPAPATTDAAGATIFYVARPALLAAAGDIPSALPAEWHDLLGEMAASRIALNEEAFELADRCSQAAQAMRERLHGAVTRTGGPTASRLALRFYGVG